VVIVEIIAMPARLFQGQPRGAASRIAAGEIGLAERTFLKHRRGLSGSRRAGGLS